MTSALRALLPQEVAVAMACGDPPPLRDSEEQYVEKVVAKRRREFALGRACARAALTQLDGRPPTPIPVGEHRAPVWPLGVVGSITHTDDLAAAAVAHVRDISALGIDVEVRRPLLPEVRTLVLTKAELAELAEHPWDVVAFSAKESVFKAWFPLTGAWLDFQDVTLTLARESGTFTAKGERLEISGRFALTDEHAVTAVALAAPRSGRDPSNFVTSGAGQADSKRLSLTEEEERKKRNGPDFSTRRIFHGS